MSRCMIVFLAAVGVYLVGALILEIKEFLRLMREDDKRG